MAANDRHFCMLPSPTPAGGRTRAALLNEARWEPGTDIRVRFLDGDASLHERIRGVAERWIGPSMANLRFTFVDSGPADIRIAFQEGDGSWSYLGTAAHQIPSSEPTMNYGWLTPDSDDQAVQSVVLHEFGHALGLIHEHQNPDDAIQWNRAAVIADLSGPPNNWDEETIEHNIFKRYDPETVTTTPTDRDSIMMYPIPAAWTLDGFSVGFNNDLSETDKDLIRRSYAW